MGGLEGCHGTGCLKETVGSVIPLWTLCLLSATPCPQGGLAGICAGWDESHSNPTNIDRILCGPQVKKTSIPHVHNIATQICSLLDWGRTAVWLGDLPHPGRQHHAGPFPFLGGEKGRKENPQEGEEGENTAKATFPITHFTTTDQLTFDCAAEPEQC